MIPPSWVAGLAAILFGVGLWGAITRRNAIIILMSVEIMLNAVNLNFVAGAYLHQDATGWMFAVFAIAIAAAEVAVGLAIFLALYDQHGSIALDEVQGLKH